MTDQSLRDGPLGGKTLAAKHQSTVSKIAAKHKATIDTGRGPRTCFEARIERPGKQPLVARFGGIPMTAAHGGWPGP